MFYILLVFSLFAVVAAFYTIKRERKSRLEAKKKLEEFERMNPIKKNKSE